MKSVLALAVLSAGLWAADTAPGMAQADPYRWCAEMGGGGEGGFTNCYFITREQCEATVAALTSLIEPLLIVFLGVVVGGIVMAMFLPIFKMSDIINPPGR